MTPNTYPIAATRPGQILSTGQVARLTGVSQGAVYRACVSGKLKAERSPVKPFHFGIPAESLRSWLSTFVADVLAAG